MPFLCLSDVAAYVSQRELTEIITSFASPESRRILPIVEETIKSYLNFIYDTAAIFGVRVYDYSNTQAYALGDIIIDSNGESFVCITAGAPTPAILTDATYFENKDPRNPLLVKIACSLYAFNIYERLPANKVPQQRIDAYNEAIANLEKIRKSIINLELPLRPETSITPTTSTHTIKVLAKKELRDPYF